MINDDKNPIGELTPSLKPPAASSLLVLLAALTFVAGRFDHDPSKLRQQEEKKFSAPDFY